MQEHLGRLLPRVENGQLHFGRLQSGPELGASRKKGRRAAETPSLHSLPSLPASSLGRMNNGQPGGVCSLAALTGGAHLHCELESVSGRRASPHTLFGRHFGRPHTRAQPHSSGRRHINLPAHFLPLPRRRKAARQDGGLAPVGQLQLASSSWPSPNEGAAESEIDHLCFSIATGWPALVAIGRASAPQRAASWQRARWQASELAGKLANWLASSRTGRTAVSRQEAAESESGGQIGTMR